MKEATATSETQITTEPSAIDKLTTAAVEKKIVSLERQIATRQGYIADAENDIEILREEQMQLRRAMRDRWAAQLGEQPGESK